MIIHNFTPLTHWLFKANTLLVQFCSMYIPWTESISNFDENMWVSMLKFSLFHGSTGYTYICWAPNYISRMCASSTGAIVRGTHHRSYNTLTVFPFYRFLATATHFSTVHNFAQLHIFPNLFPHTNNIALINLISTKFTQFHNQDVNLGRLLKKIHWNGNTALYFPGGTGIKMPRMGTNVL